MKSVLALFLCSLCLAAARTPRMTVRNADGSVKTLVIEEADISVRILGDVAETVFELDFRNDGDRAVEGEFALQLPEGATVSGYALEVNGSMRAAVSVEKERARTAYETVKRRLIDPGIVEREAGNIYRTQVYPVPARGTKRLRISYIETLAGGYSLPLDFPDPLGKFRLKIEGEGLDITDAAGVDFTEDKSGVFLSEKKAFKPSGTLRVAVGAVDGNVVILGEGEEPPFLLSALPPDLAPLARRVPKTVALIWDASGSMRGQDRSKELALLDAWLEGMNGVSVNLFALRNTMEEAGRFEVSGGKWAELRQAIKDLDCDGATDFPQIKIASGQADIALLFSDGTSTLGDKPPVIGVPWFFIHTATLSPTNPLGAMATASGGERIALSEDNVLKKLTHAAPRLISVSGVGLKNVGIGMPIIRGQRLQVFGSLKSPQAGSLELHYGYGEEIAARQTVNYHPGGKSGDLVRRLHAQRVLAGMERKLPVDRAAIIEHCKREGLVSDFTSLIVLERLEDYAEHGIRPPEKELWEEYDEMVARFEKSRVILSDRLPYQWADKLAWYAKNFPGYEHRVLPRIKQVGIWKKAVEKQFAPEQRDAEAFGVIAGWYAKGISLLEQKPKIKTGAEYEVWRKEIDALHDQGKELEATPLKAPPEVKELAVSVRGLVVTPGVISNDKPLTMRAAIGSAGGVYPFGSLDNVALYRNAGKIVYNTLSEKFTDFPLLPMDMVVVGGEFVSAYDGFADPFASGGTPSSPSTEPAIREQSDVWITQGDAGASDSLGAKPTEGGIRIMGQLEVSDQILDVKKFEEQLAAGANPESVYRKHRGEGLRDESFHIEAARLLFARKETALAKRVLSNLSENRPGDVSALRGHAFWLAEFGHHTDAEAILEAIRRDAKTELLSEMDLAAIRVSKGDFDVAYSQWVNASSWKKDLNEARDLAAVALSDFNALRVKVGDSGAFSGYRIKPDQHLPADLRIVLTCADDTTQPFFQVTEPGGFASTEHFPHSPAGGRIIGSHGVREYMIRRAVPGIYRIECRPDISTTLRLSIHTNWGRPDQSTRTVTLLRERTNADPLAEVEFEFQATE